MICDVHAHYTPKNFSQLMGDRFASPTHLPVHIRIAEITVERLNEPKLAELELLSATAKATSEDAIVMAAHRLAEVCRGHRHQVVAVPAPEVHRLHALSPSEG